jgi:hypothetical protein
VVVVLRDTVATLVQHAEVVAAQCDPAITGFLVERGGAGRVLGDTLAVLVLEA